MIGDPTKTFAKPAIGSIQEDSCVSDCIVVATIPHSWITEQTSTFDILTNDMSLVSRQDYVLISDFTLSTNSPGSCNDSFSPKIYLENPC